MTQTYSILRSRTFWTIVVAIIVAVANAVTPFLSPAAQGIVTTVLGVIAIYFHQNGMIKAGATN